MSGKPIGKQDFGETTWNKDQWKTGGAPSGWVAYDPELNLQSRHVQINRAEREAIAT